MIKSKNIWKVMACAMIFLSFSCNDNDDEKFLGPTEPGDAYFGGGAISEGVPLDKSNIDVSLLGKVAGDPDVETDPDAYHTLMQERKAVIEKAISDMVYVDGGSFYMGATAEQGNDTHIYEKNVHKVTLSSYYISKFEVTQELYLIVMGGTNQGAFKEEGNLQIPIDNRLYEEMNNFIAKLNAVTGLRFALPTEAQWEFAARGGRKRIGLMYPGSNDISTVACYWDNSLLGDGSVDHWPRSVGLGLPNELGLYDMAGNMQEVCSDWYAPYPIEDQVNPMGPSDDEGYTTRVCRGGSWYSFADACRSSARASFVPSTRYKYVGFRLVHPKVD
ncbi:formylglycine-generating enzyme family protein [Coprobacter secundus]|uniref:formylglycine-generating enzyme family protein n=1 Tax=Coprobacter secundus TaxID=1501392 RepID=UPI0022E66590|nr:formylglycine-generating enzyme family protein [Coprobacter secundus]